MGASNSSFDATNTSSAPSGLMAHRSGHDSFHADPALMGMPAVNPGLYAPRGGDHTSTILVKDGRGEDPRPSLDHLTGAPDQGNSHHAPLNPRYLAHREFQTSGGTFGART